MKPALDQRLYDIDLANKRDSYKLRGGAHFAALADSNRAHFGDAFQLPTPQATEARLRSNSEAQTKAATQVVEGEPA